MTLDGAVFTWQGNRVPHLTMLIRLITLLFNRTKPFVVAGKREPAFLRASIRGR
jgi:hypothetical protein